MGEFVDARVQQPKAIHEQIGDENFGWKESDPVLAYTQNDEVYIAIWCEYSDGDSGWEEYYSGGTIYDVKTWTLIPVPPWKKNNK